MSMITRAKYCLFLVLLICLSAPAYTDTIPPALPQAGEIELSGWAVKSDTVSRTLLVAVDYVTLPGGQKFWFPAARRKPVNIDSQTVIVTPDQIAQTQADLTEGESVTIFGKDSGIGRAMTARLLMFRSGVNTPDGDGLTPLMRAGLDSNLDRVKILLAAGADVSATGQNGETPIEMAAYSGSEDCIKALIALSADPNTKDNWGKTALTWANQTGHADCTTALQAAGGTM
jgi:hypothetical protein